MLNKAILPCLIYACGLTVNQSLAQSISQQSLQTLAETLVVTYQVVNNSESQLCEANQLLNCSHAKLSLSFQQNHYPDTWSLYFTHLSPIQKVVGDDVSIEHINGDLHRLTLKRAVAKNEMLNIRLLPKYWQVNRSDIVPNMYVDAPELNPVIVESTTSINDVITGVNYAKHAGHFDTPAQYRRHNVDEMPQADGEWLYEHYQSMAAGELNTETQTRVIPALLNSKWQSETLSIENGVNVSKLPFTLNTAQLSLLNEVGININSTGVPLLWEHINPDAKQSQEQYQIVIEKEQIRVVSANITGFDYALASLVQLYDKQSKSFKLGMAQDQPAFSYRGMHMDIARNFNGKNVIFELLEQMYRSKLNRLHLHFADDEGWRVEIQSLPELTEVGAFRCADNKSCILPQLGAGPHRESDVNGYLTTNDYIELVAFARERHIEVIPSFDMPGHARAAIMQWSSALLAIL